MQSPCPSYQISGHRGSLPQSDNMAPCVVLGCCTELIHGQTQHAAPDLVSNPACSPRASSWGLTYHVTQCTGFNPAPGFANNVQQWLCYMVLELVGQVGLQAPSRHRTGTRVLSRFSSLATPLTTNKDLFFSLSFKTKVHAIYLGLLHTRKSSLSLSPHCGATQQSPPTTRIPLIG